MKKDNVDYKTKCRCLFILTISLYYNADTLVDDNFMNALHSYVRDSLFNKTITFDDAYLILYFKKINYTYSAYESEKTISDLFNELDNIKSYEGISNLYKEIKQKDIDRITFLAYDFINYMNRFNINRCIIPM